MDKEENVNKKKGIRNLKICSGILALTTAITLMSLSCGKNKDGEQSVTTTVVEEITSVPEETTVSTTTVEQVSTTTPKVTTVKETTSEVTTTQEEVTTPSTTTKEETTKEITKAPEETTSKTTTIKKEETTKKTTTTEDNSQIEEVLKLTKNNINDVDSFLNYYDVFLGHTFSISDYYGFYNFETDTYESCIASDLESRELWLAVANLQYMNVDTLNELFGDFSSNQIHGLITNIVWFALQDFERNRSWEFENNISNKNDANFFKKMQIAIENKDFEELELICNENFEEQSLAVKFIASGVIIEYNLESSISEHPSYYAHQLASKLTDKMGKEPAIENWPPLLSTVKSKSIS